MKRVFEGILVATFTVAALWFLFHEWQRGDDSYQCDVCGWYMKYDVRGEHVRDYCPGHVCPQR